MEMAAGTTIVEIREGADEEIGIGLMSGVIVYPTGLWAVVKDDWLRARITGEIVTDKHGCCFVEAEVWDALGLERQD